MATTCDVLGVRSVRQVVTHAATVARLVNNRKTVPPERFCGTVDHSSESYVAPGDVAERRVEFYSLHIGEHRWPLFTQEPVNKCRGQCVTSLPSSSHIEGIQMPFTPSITNAPP